MFYSVSLFSQAPLARGSRALPSVLLCTMSGHPSGRMTPGSFPSWDPSTPAHNYKVGRGVHLFAHAAVIRRPFGVGSVLSVPNLPELLATTNYNENFCWDSTNATGVCE